VDNRSSLRRLRSGIMVVTRGISLRIGPRVEMIWWTGISITDGWPMRLERRRRGCWTDDPGVKTMKKTLLLF